MGLGLIYYIQSGTDGIVNSTESNSTETFRGKRVVIFFLFPRRMYQLLLVTKVLFYAASGASYGC